MDAESPSLNRLCEPLLRDGFLFVPGAVMRADLERHGSLSDWQAFAASWNDLAFDSYLAGHGRYRRRRYAVFSACAVPGGTGGSIVRAPHQPHYQSRDYNSLQGGIERWFEPILPAIADGSVLQTTLRFCHHLFGSLVPTVRRWHVEVHQFRIEARLDEPGQPTPEGVHRDGVDFVLVMMVRRNNIAQGTTTIHALAGEQVGAFTLTDPFDAALVDDSRVYHGVTAVEAIDPDLPAHRDVLVVTFRRDD